MSQEESFKTFEGLARKLARQYRVEGVDLEDLEQEAFLTVLVAVPLWTPDSKSTLKTFVCDRIKNALRDYRNKSVRKNHVSLDGPAGKQDFDGEEMTMHDIVAGEVPNPESAIDAKRVHASQSIQRTPVVAEIIRLRSGGLTFEEIGERLGKKTNTVIKAWRRACKRLPNTSKTAA